MKFLTDEQLGELQPNQCEVTYVNILELEEGSDPHRQLELMTPLWSGRTNEPVPGTLENCGVQMSYLMVENEQPFGRIYVNFQPALRQADLRPVMRLEITARGKPS